MSEAPSFEDFPPLRSIYSQFPEALEYADLTEGQAREMAADQGLGFVRVVARDGWFGCSGDKDQSRLNLILRSGRVVRAWVG